MLTPDARGLVIIGELDQTLMPGPPYAVFEDELRALYAGWTVELLEEGPAPPLGRCAQLGVPATLRSFAIRSSLTARSG